MKLKPIDWNHVTKFSQLVAIVLFVGIFFLGFLLGKTYEYHAFTNSLKAGISSSMPTAAAPIAAATYLCEAGKTIRATYYKDHVHLDLSDNRQMSLPQAMSGSGARYANKDESIVFWNKGTTAFVTEGKTTTFANCDSKPVPE